MNRRRRDRFLEPGRRADVRLPGGRDRRPSTSRCCSRPRIAPPTSRGRELDPRRAERARRATSGFHVRKNGDPLLLQRHRPSGCGESLGFAKIARDLSTQPAGAPRRCASSRRTSRCACANAPTRSRREVSARAAAHHHVTVLLQRSRHRAGGRARAHRPRPARSPRPAAHRAAADARRVTAISSAPAIRRTGRSSSALSLAQQIDDDLDFLAWELRPAALDDHRARRGAARSSCASGPRITTIPVEYRAQQLHRADSSRRDAEVVFYRVAQEALNNVLKHAHATRVDVLVERRDGAVRMVIEDNGVGFEVEREGETRDKGIGIIGMRERAALIGGTLQIESQPGQGTSVYLEAPIAKSMPALKSDQEDSNRPCRGSRDRPPGSGAAARRAARTSKWSATRRTVASRSSASAQLKPAHRGARPLHAGHERAGCHAGHQGDACRKSR